MSSFTEDWFGQPSQDRLAVLVGEVADVPGIIIEIGSWEGRSTVALANAAHPRTVHAIDTWAGSPGEVSADLASQRDVYATWQANVVELTAGNVQAHRMGWREALPTVTDQIALAFIDAEHTYREVFDNITALLPLMAPGGIICGDDVHHPPVRQALAEHFGLDNVLVQATVWSWVRNGPTMIEIEADAIDSSGGWLCGSPEVFNRPVHPGPVAGFKWQPPLKQEYERLCATPSDIYLHLPRMVELVQATNAQHVIELGTRTGVSTVAWLHALNATGGRLTSVDLDERPPIGEHEHWTYIRGDDMDPDISGSLEPADIVFIDTSHWYQHTLQELHTYRWLVKPGGYIVCHDTELSHPEGMPQTDPVFPVKRAIERFVAETGFEWRNVSECYGLGIIKVV